MIIKCNEVNSRNQESYTKIYWKLGKHIEAFSISVVTQEIQNEKAP
jgi:hypothetical protein